MRRPPIIPAVSVVLRDGARFLLVERGREPAKGQWAFPGGKIRIGESAENAARRELAEETGLNVDELEPFDTFELATMRDGKPVLYRLSVFQCSQPTGVLRAGDDANTLGWFTVEAMATLPATPSTIAVATAIADALRTPQ
ncbi:MAG: NUDIX domain-containing protein [Phyllobacteriaceae bacterium]|nr:NUDIX domain-containing protein [Phyllobacteriaceae bacterium]